MAHPVPDALRGLLDGSDGGVLGEVVEKENDFVFIFAGGVPPFRFLNQMGIKFGGDEVCSSTT